MRARPKSQRSRKKRVQRIPPESPAARDEGPRLIPLPDSDPHSPTEGYVSLANSAIRLWNKADKPATSEPPSKTDTDR